LKQDNFSLLKLYKRKNFVNTRNYGLSRDPNWSEAVCQKCFVVGEKLPKCFEGLRKGRSIVPVIGNRLLLASAGAIGGYVRRIAKGGKEGLKQRLIWQIESEVNQL
jgi:hypothetical protein